MNRRERFFSCMTRSGYDRIPIMHPYGTPEFHKKLYARLGCNHDELLDKVEHVFEWVFPKQIASRREPEFLKDYPEGSSLGSWGEIYSPQEYGIGENTGHYGEASYLPFADITDPAQLKDYEWPSADWYDYSGIREKCQDIKARGKVAMYCPFSFDFINNIGRTRGVTQTLMDIGLRDPVFLLLMEKRFEFHHEMDRRVFEAADGEIDVGHVCEDLGGRYGPLISMPTFEELFAPRFKAAFDLAHKYGTLTMMHICGGIRPMLPRLIDLGLDIFDVVQVAAKGMEIEGLARDFGKDIVFCGSMCVQSFLAQGTPEIVTQEVEKRLRLFPDGGLILGPSHDIQVHTPVENVIAMYQAAGYLKDV